ncbi:hypothetical protein E5F05_09675 [Deinococcus metallilatus]|uniref:Uncharacterized protein n=2 Tax=Deinococcus TaxID=1298 RepID=A0AAJ5K4Q3_9DEIO|nr:hypothetical protein [Deinococcus metallilatus]MBB5295993.1 hypothetical protein [Deinococcus metallilatus]QBY08186.1 hypothetical protein E5F05_09675 [Deinococcus metallilatus]RXJ11918.1 hypothetical protein ERJ73_08485 [Deinococcus metallilatus]TLK25850.1 hypothetical protein FCS05_12495 [Deinococcus metallilatus]GMA14472.1 hypothetical protein GCM10025871_08030 [Deinococcus metallilatus]
MNEGRSDQPSGQTGPQDNVPQERVQTNPNWDTGGEKTPSERKQDRYWDQVNDDNRDAGAGTPTTGNPQDDQAGVIGAQDRNPSTYGGMEAGLPASGATTDPDKTTDGEQGS